MNADTMNDCMHHKAATHFFRGNQYPVPHVFVKGKIPGELKDRYCRNSDREDKANSIICNVNNCFESAREFRFFLKT